MMLSSTNYNYEKIGHLFVIYQTTDQKYGRNLFRKNANISIRESVNILRIGWVCYHEDHLAVDTKDRQQRIGRKDQPQASS